MLLNGLLLVACCSLLVVHVAVVESCIMFVVRWCALVCVVVRCCALVAIVVVGCSLLVACRLLVVDCCLMLLLVLLA